MDSQVAHSGLALIAGGAVGTVCRFLVQAGLHGRAAMIGAAAVSLFFVVVGALDAGDFVRGNYMTYLLQYVEILAIAGGAFKGTEVAQQRFRGTGSG